MAPRRAAAKASGRKSASTAPSDVPTRTGATDAGSVRARAAMIQMRTVLGPARELREVGLALLDVGVTPFLGLGRHVEEEVGVVRELLQAGESVLVGVEARLEQAQGEGRELEHLTTPRDGLLLEALERDDRVHQPHVQRLLRVVLAAEEPDLLGLLGAHEPREHTRAEAAVEAADLGPGLAEARVLGG